jgi:hypothetical protein
MLQIAILLDVTINVISSQYESIRKSKMVSVSYERSKV